MVDDNQTGMDPEDLENLAAQKDLWDGIGSSVKETNYLAGMYSKIVSGFPTKEASEEAEKLVDKFSKLSGMGAKDITAALIDAKNSASDLIGSIDFTGIDEKMSAVASGIQKNMLEVFSELTKGAGDTTAMVTSVAAIGLADLQVKAVDSMPGGFNKLQEQIKEVQEEATIAGMKFGETFSTADASTDAFTTSLARSIETTHQTREAIISVRKALSTAFSGRETMESLNGLKAGMQGVGSAVDLTNVALTVSKATGQDANKVAQQMADIHLDLGSSLKDTALSFGHIKGAADGSGLAYDKVANSILGAAKTLKFYGATVESISPVFKRFNESMKGIGKEGLTPELIDSFIGGLKGMTMNTKALLSLSAPGMQGGGVLSGGLQMEKALETGEGMDKIMTGMADTIKQFSGPIITRDEALADPSKAQDYTIQRQLLGKLSGIGDTDKQNQMMQVLKDMDQHGMATGADATKKLQELMGGGEEVAREMATDLQHKQLDKQQTLVTQGVSALEYLATIAKGSGIYAISESISEFQKSLSSGTGRVNPEALESMIKNIKGKMATSDNPEERAKLSALLNDAGKIKSADREKYKVSGKDYGTIDAEATMGNAVEEYKRALKKKYEGFDKEAIKAMEKTGIISAKEHKELLEGSAKIVENKLKEIDKRLKNADLTAKEKVALKTQKEVIESKMDEFKKSFSADRGMVDIKNAGVSFGAIAKNEDVAKKEKSIEIVESIKDKYTSLSGDYSGRAGMIQSAAPIDLQPLNPDMASGDIASASKVVAKTEPPASPPPPPPPQEMEVRVIVSVDDDGRLTAALEKISREVSKDEAAKAIRADKAETNIDGN